MECQTARNCIAQRPISDAGHDTRETLLLLHGSAGSGALWRDLCKGLAPLYRTLTPDLIGYGQAAPWPEAKPFALADEVERIEAFLPCCERRIHVVGYSYGGAVALEFARANPIRLKTLTLIEPVSFAALRETGEAAAYATLEGVHARFNAAFTNREGAMREFIDFWTGTGSWDALPASMREVMLSQAGKIRLDWAASFAANPGTALLAELARRTLLVRGDRSPEPMVKLVDALHELMAGSTEIIVRGANHLLPLTHGTQLAEALIAHLHAEGERTAR